MSGHPFKSYARAVQAALEANTDLARPSYTWCLHHVIQNIAYARELAEKTEGGTLAARTKANLIALARSRAPKAG